MLKLWSEVPGARAREVAADAGTALWVAVWILASRRLYEKLAEFAAAGRVIQNGGRNLEAAGGQIGDALGGIPMIGANVGELVHFAIAFAARPFFAVGSYLEHILLINAILFSLIVLVVPLALWLARYVPWRWERLKRLGAAQRVIRTAPQISSGEIEHLLASRALHRLSYEHLLKYSPDPFGDWSHGRYGRLAQAELASVGLRPHGPHRAAPS